MAVKAKRKVTFNEEEADKTLPNELIDEFPTIANKLWTFPVHLPLILGGMFYNGLTEDVTGIMAKGLITLILTNGIYDYLIYTNTIIPSQKKRKSDDNMLLLFITSALLPLVLSLPVLVILILFGAPLSTHIEETFLLATHVSFILFNPLLILYKMNVSQFGNFFRLSEFFKNVFKNQIVAACFVSVIGTWLGVLPIPLDWDRPWQNWPITLLVGSYLGFFTGAVINLAF